MTQRTCKIAFFQCLLFALAVPAFAQEVPTWEFFGGYSFQRTSVREYYVRTPTPLIYGVQNRDANLNGWDVAVTENMNKSFGGTLDISGHYGTPVYRGVSTRQQMHSLLYGPRFSLRKSAFVPFVHVLFGVARASVQVTPVGPHTSDISFAVAGGGGLDLNLGGRAAVRVFQAEYFRANALGSNQNNYRASVGLIYRVGKIK